MRITNNMWRKIHGVSKKRNTSLNTVKIKTIRNKECGLNCLELHWFFYSCSYIGWKTLWVNRKFQFRLELNAFFEHWMIEKHKQHAHWNNRFSTPYLKCLIGRKMKLNTVTLSGRELNLNNQLFGLHYLRRNFLRGVSKPFTNTFSEWTFLLQPSGSIVV